MNNLLTDIRIALLRASMQIARFRHRNGYGIHSPFAFRILTEVIHQELPYYAYSNLLQEEKRQAAHEGRRWRREPLRVKRLLFRLANEVRADYLFDVGPAAASSLYLQAARTHSTYHSATSADDFFLEADEPIHLLYLHDYSHPEWVEQVFQLCVTRTVRQSLFIIEGIGYTPAMRELWQRMQQDPHTGITFDLFDVGLIFFDRRMNRQHYKAI